MVSLYPNQDSTDAQSKVVININEYTITFNKQSDSSKKEDNYSASDINSSEI